MIKGATKSCSIEMSSNKISQT